MPWNARHLREFDAVEITYSGTVTARELHEAATAAAALIDPATVAHILADCTQLAPGGHSVVDLYNLCRDGLPRAPLKEAVIFPADPALWGNVEFWQTTCANRGYNVRAFRDRAEAIAWLGAAE